MEKYFKKEELLLDRSKLVESLKTLESSNKALYTVHNGTTSFTNIYGIKSEELEEIIKEKIKRIDEILGL